MNYYTGNLSTKQELADGASAMQGLTAHCHAQAVEALALGLNNHAIAWQKAHAKHHRSVVEFMKLLARKETPR